MEKQTTNNNTPIDAKAIEALQRVVLSLSAKALRGSIIEALAVAGAWNDCYDISVLDVLGRLVALNLASGASHDLGVETGVDDWAAAEYCRFMTKARVRGHFYPPATNGDQHNKES